MTRDFQRPTGRDPIDDEAIARLVRDVAGGWSMPPVRLDAPSWRDRVRSPRARWLDSVRGWLVRVGQAATAAVVLTVVGALVAVLLLRPPMEPGSSPEPSDRGTGPLPTSAAFTPLPKFHVDGDVPNPAEVLVELEQGDFAVVDLATGARGPVPIGADFGSVVRWRSDGTLLCLCVKLGADANTRPTEAVITIDRFDASGAPLSSVPAVTLVGDPDPRDGTLPERPPHVAFDLRLSEGGRFGIIGWSVRKHPAWQNGITIVDLADGREVSQIRLPDDTTGESDTRRVVLAPRLLGGGEGSVVLAREWYSWSPPDSEGENFRQGTDVFTASMSGGVLSDPEPLGTAADCGERVVRAGSTRDGGLWLVCSRSSTNSIVIRRLDAAGMLAGDTTLTAPIGVDGDLVALSPDGETLFAWQPVSATLARIDLATGEMRQGSASGTAARPSGALTALGDWLAPAATAKSFLQSGVVVSPDGTRVYAAGLDGVDVDAVSGSSGIHVFDAATLTSLGRWEPTADFISLAVSNDGRFVYAAGLARFDASGRERPSQQASITVFAAADGEVQVIAGNLGFDFLTFATPILD